MIKLREYQKEALEYALKNKKATIVLPTGTGKTIIGMFFIKKLLEKNPKLRAIVLEPTRILVEQVYEVYKRENLPVKKIYGIFKKEVRKELWRNAKIVVTTPETAFFDLESSRDFEIVIVDECHHSIGNDAYAKFLKESTAEYRLGLSAYIPRTRKNFIERLIGPIKTWPLNDPKIQKYIPDWIGDIYEARFNKEEWNVYKEIESRRRSVKEKMLYTLALKYLSVDGALALKETISKKTKISELLADLKESIQKLRNLHKLPQLYRILKDYDGFEKAIIFVDRVIVARQLETILSKKYSVSLILGKRNIDQKEALEKARESKIVISTSAGEEGVDLPSADLLIIWSNTSNPLRFIQRHGRILRPTKPLKFVVYIITPFTLDTELFLRSVIRIKDFIDIRVPDSMLKKIWAKSPLSQILDYLEYPMYIEWLKEITGFTLAEIWDAIKVALKNGDIIYIYTPAGKLYVRKDKIDLLYKEFKEYLSPKYKGKVKIYKKTITGDWRILVEKLSKYLPLQNLYITIIKESKDLIEYDFKKYNFLIDSKQVLEVVIRNALSA